jgi:hypothetical protein
MATSSHARPPANDTERLLLASTFDYEERDMTDERLPTYGEALASNNRVSTAVVVSPRPSTSAGDVDDHGVWRPQQLEEMTTEAPQAGSSSPSRLQAFGKRPKCSLLTTVLIFIAIGSAVTMGGVIRHVLFTLC